MTTNVQARLVWDIGAALGEGPAWIDDMLWFVDIKRGDLHRHDPATGENRSFAVGGDPSFVLPDDRGGLVVGDRRALRRVVDGAVVETIATIGMPEGNRTNDATVDRDGRLWFGTMDDGETAPTGRVYRLDTDGPIEMGGACVITNGPAVDADGRWLYHVDTLAGTIWRFDVSKGGPLTDGTVFAQIAPGDGHPDGVTIDSEGCLWVGLWGGWAVRRYAPDGTRIGEVALPCANATKVAFGGPGLTTGYVTTASVGLSDAERARQPLAGGLFAFDAPAPGLPLPRVRLPG